MADTWSIIVHGGAHEIAEELRMPHLEGCERAARAGQAILEAGGAALAAVEAAIRVLEDDRTFNAGYGSVLNTDGEVECDAAIMDGETLDVGGVCSVQGIRNPISVASLMLRERPTLLAADGAERFAREHGAELCDPAALIAPHRRQDSAADTVGCVALDTRGRIAAGTSTGGVPGKMPGRVGDSPLPGGGLYAERGVGGISLSGDGEKISRLTLAARIMGGLRLDGTDPDATITEHLDLLGSFDGSAGVILLDADGRPAWGHSTSDFAVAHASSDSPVRAFTRRGKDSAPPKERQDDTA